MYKFSNEWFEYQRPIIEKYFSPSQEKMYILEIGAFEGRSTVFYINNYLKHQDSHIDVIDSFDTNDKTTTVTSMVEENYIHNINCSKYPNKVTLYKTHSQKALPLLNIENKKYNYITIDASHLTEDVLTDCVLSYPLLENNGIMFLDDYGNEHVKKAVDSFMNCFSSKMETLYSGYHYIARKK